MAIWCCSIGGSQAPCGTATTTTTTAAGGATARGCGDNSETKPNILLCNVLESILVREFQKSCDFTAVGEDSNAVAHNTPFRGDHPESLMIT
mgnify:CR=1 FL=1